ncbi:MAG: hypothetical protein KAS32_07170 [Candidatus Peribacteraceae bacterium]|nr:hypothetical protein [Candidatus Peribacteraceae bacterium]
MNIGESPEFDIPTNPEDSGDTVELNENEDSVFDLVEDKIKSNDKVISDPAFAEEVANISFDIEENEKTFNLEENIEENNQVEKLKEKYEADNESRVKERGENTVADVIRDEENNIMSNEEASQKLQEAREETQEESITKSAETFLGEKELPKNSSEEKEVKRKQDKVREYLKSLNPDVKVSQWEAITRQVIEIERMQDNHLKKVQKQQLVLRLSLDIGISETEAEMLYETLYGNREDIIRVEDLRATETVLDELGLDTAREYAEALDENDPEKLSKIEESLPEKLRDKLRRARKYSIILNEDKRITEAKELEKGKKEKPKLSRKLRSSLKEHGALKKFNKMEFTPEEIQAMEDMNNKADTAALIAEVLKNNSQKMGSVVQGKILNVYVLIRLDSEQVEFIGEHAVREVIAPRSKYIIEPPSPEQFNIVYISMLAEQNGMSYFANTESGIETNRRIAKIFAGDISNGKFITGDGANMQRAFLRIVAGGKEKSDEEAALYKWGVKSRGSNNVNETRLIHIHRAFQYYMDGMDERGKDFDDFTMDDEDVTTLCMAWDKNGFDKKTMPNTLDELKSWTKKRLEAKDQNLIIEEMIIDMEGKQNKN